MTFIQQWATGLFLVPVVLAGLLPLEVIAVFACAWISGVCVLLGLSYDFGEHVFRFQSLAGGALVGLAVIPFLGFFARRVILMCVALVGVFLPVIDTRSMNGVFLALVFPFALKENKFLAAVLGAGIMFSESTTAICLLALGLSLTNLRVFILAAIGALSYATYNQGLTRFLDEGGRFNVWQSSFEWWIDRSNWFFGTGFSTYGWLGPMIQASKGDEQYLVWMHNDWLQILFEQGILGLSASFLLFGSMLWRSRKETALFASVCVYGASMATQMPLHFFITALWGAILVKEVYLVETDFK
jgi:O-antigen ligase